MNMKFTLCAALAVLVGCANTTPPRPEPTYEDAAASKFVVSSREAINKLVAGFDLGPLEIRQFWWPQLSMSTTHGDLRRLAVLCRSNMQATW